MAAVMDQLSCVLLLTSFLAYVCKHIVNDHVLEREARSGPDSGDFPGDPCAGARVCHGLLVALGQRTMPQAGS